MSNETTVTNQTMGGDMKTFWRLLEESVILQGVLTIGILGSLVYMWVAQVEVPNELYAFFGLILGHWFGTKSQFAINKARKVS